MKTFFEIRGKIQEITARIWPYLVYLIKFIAAWIAFSKVNEIFGGSIAVLGKSYVPLGLAVISLFLNFATIGLLLLIYTSLNMLGISWIFALVTLVLGVFLFGAAIYFNRRMAGLFWIMPLLTGMGIPYAAPLACGMFCPVTACGGIAVGTVTAYYIKAMIGYLPNFADEESTVTALDVFMEQIVANSSFYILLIALTLMTVTVYTVGLIRVQGAKLYALTLGLIVEILVQLAGKLFFNTGVDMGQVTKSSLWVFLIGLVLAFFGSEGNYSRIEKVRFEDDDYIYHVHAIPKTRIAKAQKKVTNVTRDTSKMDITSNLGAVVEVSGKKHCEDKGSSRDISSGDKKHTSQGAGLSWPTGSKTSFSKPASKSKATDQSSKSKSSNQTSKGKSTGGAGTKSRSTATGTKSRPTGAGTKSGPSGMMPKNKPVRSMRDEDIFIIPQGEDIPRAEQDLQIDGLHTDGLYTDGLHTDGLHTDGLHTDSHQAGKIQLNDLQKPII